MFLQEAPAETLDFMIFGYTVILGSIALFVLSIWLRFRRLQRDLEALRAVEDKLES
jgi:hypothetical protein